MADAPGDTKPADATDAALKTTEATDAALKAALQDAGIPKVYANGFALGLGNADVFIVFQRFGPNPVAVVNLSYTLAKTLAQRLGWVVSEFERVIGEQNILTTDRIDEAFKKNQSRPKAKPTESEDNVH